MENNDMPISHTATPEHTHSQSTPSPTHHKGQPTSRRDLQGGVPEAKDHRKINALQMQPCLLFLTYIFTLVSAMLSTYQRDE